MKLLYWGTYDTGKPRNRILLRGLRENHIFVSECHSEIWSGIEDKSQVKEISKKILFFLRTLVCYPRLIFHFLKEKNINIVIIGYLGHLDVIILWPFARFRRIPICWDAFISLYDTIVNDRRLISKYNPLAWLLFCWEWLACRCCDIVLMDTTAHCELLQELYGLEEAKTAAVIVGAEPEKFPLVVPQKRSNSGSESQNDMVRVLFYGQFIPLHGIETIIAAAHILQHQSVEWVIIGQGQEQDKIKALLKQHPLRKLKWRKWVNYDKLSQCIADADICLGIFGTSAKAARVIPNKVFQILSSGKPLITRDSPALRELLPDDFHGVYLVEAGNAQTLADTILTLVEQKGNLIDLEALSGVRKLIRPEAIGKSLLAILEKLQRV